MKSSTWTEGYFRELWRSHHAEVMMILPTIGFGLADLRTQGPSLWGGLAAASLLFYLGFILLDAGKTMSALSGVVDVPYSIITHKSIEEAELYFASHAQSLLDHDVPLRRILDRFLISGPDWRYYDQNRVTDGKRAESLNQIRSHFIRLSRRVTAPARYHLFFVTVAPIGLAFGATIGRDIRCKAYQFFGAAGLVATFDPESVGKGDSCHGLQEKVREFKEVKVECSGNDNAHWSAEIPMIATKGPLYEYACHEGNYGLSTILSGARYTEKKAAQGARDPRR